MRGGNLGAGRPTFPFSSVLLRKCSPRLLASAVLGVEGAGVEDTADERKPEEPKAGGIAFDVFGSILG